jgi:hypothetical protein
MNRAQTPKFNLTGLPVMNPLVAARPQLIQPVSLFFCCIISESDYYAAGPSAGSEDGPR